MSSHCLCLTKYFPLSTVPFIQVGEELLEVTDDRIWNKNGKIGFSCESGPWPQLRRQSKHVKSLVGGE